MRTSASTLNLAICLGLFTTGAVTTTTGCAGQYNRSTGQYIGDSLTKVRVEDALHNNPEYKFDGVDVDVFRGTVQLSGFVDTDDQKSKAEDIAKGFRVSKISSTTSRSNRSSSMKKLFHFSSPPSFGLDAITSQISA